MWHFENVMFGAQIKKWCQRHSEKDMWVCYWTTYSSRLPGFSSSCCIPLPPFFLTWPRHTIGKNSIATQLPRDVNLTDSSATKKSESMSPHIDHHSSNLLAITFEFRVVDLFLLWLSSLLLVCGKFSASSCIASQLAASKPHPTATMPWYLRFYILVVWPNTCPMSH